MVWRGVPNLRSSKGHPRLSQALTATGITSPFLQSEKMNQSARPSLGAQHVGGKDKGRRKVKTNIRSRSSERLL
jgi:hypothetical protein